MNHGAAHQRVLAALAAHGCKVANGGTAATCPAHDDRAPSLSLTTQHDRVLLHCHAGCDTVDVVTALGLSMGDLFDEKERASSARPLAVATYPYTDEQGTVLFEKVRLEPKSFRQRHDVSGRTEWNLNGVRRVLYRLPDVRQAVASGTPVYLTEGEKDADALARAGVTATTWTEGAWQDGQSPKWRQEYTETLRGADVVIVRDNDVPGRHTAMNIAVALTGVAASLRVVEAKSGKDAFDHLAAGHSIDDLRPVEDPPPAAKVETVSRTQAHAVFRRWLGDAYDLEALDVVLAAAAVEQLDGDPVWVLMVSGSGNAKTETVASLAAAGAFVTSTITSEGALLSATSRKETSKDATGGLLRRIGDRGVVVVKDVTSILSMNSDTRGAVLAALREVYDGRWERNVGTDGGRTLTWEGRIVLIGAVTTAYDKAHGVIASMGDRFALIRVDSAKGRMVSGRQALSNVGDEVQMRAELAAAAAGVLAGVDPTRAKLTEDVRDTLLAAADVVTLARTAVERDYKGTPEWAHAPEAPTRFAKCLGQIVRGSLTIGVPADQALSLALRVARDSVPPLRLLCLLDVLAHPSSRTSDVTKRVQRPRNTVDRTLQELHLLELVEVDEGEHQGGWHYTVPDHVDRDALALLNLVSGKTTTGVLGVKEREPEQVSTPTGISGHKATSTEVSVTGEGRCRDCSWHVQSMGHGLTCPRREAS